MLFNEWQDAAVAAYKDSNPVEVYYRDPNGDGTMWGGVGTSGNRIEVEYCRMPDLRQITELYPVACVFYRSRRLDHLLIGPQRHLILAKWMLHQWHRVYKVKQRLERDSKRHIAAAQKHIAELQWQIREAQARISCL